MRISFFVCVLFSNMLFCPLIAGSICQKNKSSKRCLNGHLFTTPMGVESPLVTTNVSTNFGGSVGTFVDRRELKPTYHRVAKGGVGYDLQIAFLDWLAIYGMASGGLRLGDGPDAVRLGIGAEWRYKLGSKFRLVETQHILLTTDLGIVGNGFKGMQPVRALANLPAVTGELPACLTPARNRREFKVQNRACFKIQQVLEAFDSSLGPSLDLNLLLGLNKVMSLWVSTGASYLFRSTSDLGNFGINAHGGVFFSVDMSPVVPVPLGGFLGTQFNYQLLSPSNNQANIELGALTIRGGLFYTGSEDFSIGLEISDEVIPFIVGVTGTRDHTISANVGLRYYWN